MKMFLKINFIIVLFACISFGSANEYEKYKIYDIQPKNGKEKEIVTRLAKNPKYDFFILPRNITESVRVMIQPEDQDEFELTLNEINIKFTIVQQNVGRMMKQQNEQILRSRSNFDTSNRFARFQRFDEINAYLNSLAKSYPNRVSVQTIGTSYEGRNLNTITISNGDGRIGKKVILLDAGIHAREWIAHAGALYVIYQLVENVDANSHLLNDYDWIILPVVNPDGYEFTHTHARFWRKTVKPISGMCFGTDGNRNFDFHWGEVGTSDDPCHETFQGASAFSEPETQDLRDLMLSLTGRAQMYLTLHAYGNFLLYPWGYTADLPSNWRDIDEVAQAGAAAIRSATGTLYTVGSPANVLYPAAGGSIDYALAEAKIPISITMELPAGGTGFNPFPNQIEPIATETWIGIKAMAEKVISKY